MKWTRSLILAALGLALPLAVLAAGLTSGPAGGAACPTIQKGQTCYYSIGTSTTDSDAYRIDKNVTLLSYKLEATGGCTMRIYECDDSAKTTCTAFVDDVNQDGVIDSSDESTSFTGAAGLRGQGPIAPRWQWQYIKVDNAPSSGTCTVLVRGF